jgi:hypothetical protein
MALTRTTLARTGLAVWVAFVLFLLTATTFPRALEYFFGATMNFQNKLAVFQLFVSILGFGGAVAAFVFAIVQYKRGEKWRRTEFLAREIKEFESDPTIQNALLMIDWGVRKINLFLKSDPKDSDLIKITREVQWKALLPHTVKKDTTDYRDSTNYSATDLPMKGAAGQAATFTPVEAKIRDSYDALLSRLDRFATYIASGLISPAELKPFLRYWIDALTTNEHVAEDAAWRCTLLTYINFYDYTGVKELLKHFDKNITPQGPIYTELKNSMPDTILANRLFESVKNKG